MKRKVVAVTGLSGVGKSTLIKTLAASILFEHLQASALIKEVRDRSGDVAIMQDRLKLADIEENQQLLIRSFRLKVGTSAGLVILDGHTVIERGDELTRIDARVFGAIGIESMIFLSDDPDAIAKRWRDDTTRKRPLLSVDKLRLVQDEAREHATVICQTLGIPFHAYRPDEVALIAYALRQRDLIVE